jgi:hypothetical protein
MYPVLLFTYKRLQTLKNTISHLLLNPEVVDTDLFIFSDGPKLEEDKLLIEQVRKYLATISGFKTITISLSDSNKGLANSVISGVSKVLSHTEAVIVLEDDLVVSNDFLHYMNVCLNKYKNSKKVFSISGFSLPFKHDKVIQSDVYFLNRGWSWGWATWRDRWIDIDWEIKDYDSFVSSKLLKKKFALCGSDLNVMLAKQIAGNLDSWAIRWMYNQFKIGSLTAYPLYTKVVNRGFDQHATHTKGSSRRYKTKNVNFSKVKTTINLPDIVATNPYYTRQFLNKMSFFARIQSKIESILKKIFNWNVSQLTFSRIKKL